MEKHRTCARCVLDSTVPSVTFDEKGVCNHCKLHDKLEEQYKINDENKKKFEKILEVIKLKGKKNKYDCLIGLSGGIDSTYCLYIAKQLGLRPLAVHYDNGWVTDVAKKNIQKTVQRLNVDIREVGSSHEDIMRYHRACIRASIPETCMPCEVGIVSAIYDVAVKENIKYIILGTSFRTEGINPLRWHYLDGAYFNDVLRKFDKLDDKARKFNKLTISKMFYYIVVKGIKSIQLPLYINYRNDNIKEKLKEELGWEYGGRAHFDCCYKPFGGKIEARFERNPVKTLLSALVRTGEMTRAEALAKLNEPYSAEDTNSVDYCKEKLGLTDEEIQKIMKLEPKTFLDFKTYFPLVNMLRGPIKLCCKLNILPETMYEKLFMV